MYCNVNMCVCVFIYVPISMFVNICVYMRVYVCVRNKKTAIDFSWNKGITLH